MRKYPVTPCGNGIHDERNHLITPCGNGKRFKKGQKMLETIGVFMMLTVSSVFDIRKKIIPIQVLVVGGIWAVICLTISVARNGAEVLTGALPGLLPGAGLMVLGFLTQQKVGYGDGILLMIMGLMEGGRIVLLTFCIGLFLQSILAVILVLIRRADKQTKIPFVPFLLTARVIILFV